MWASAIMARTSNHSSAARGRRRRSGVPAGRWTRGTLEITAGGNAPRPGEARRNVSCLSLQTHHRRVRPGPHAGAAAEARRCWLASVLHAASLSRDVARLPLPALQQPLSLSGLAAAFSW